MAASFTLAARLRAGETVHSGWCALGAPIVAELVARAGFPAVTLDQQHGLYTMDQTAAAIAAVRMAGAAPVVRVPLGDIAVASRILDFGAEGVIAPMINTAADARAFAAAAKYPPLGERSFGPLRALILNDMDGADYVAQANGAIVTIAMVETRQALDNLEAILATPGIDAVFVGPSDLSLALTEGKTLDPHSREVDAAIDRIGTAASKAGKIAGAYAANAERANELGARGFRFLGTASDTAFVRAGTAATWKALVRNR
jgi:4-hydroxy-2-oxoheptanedioate aldolase